MSLRNTKHEQAISTENASSSDKVDIASGGSVRGSDALCNLTICVSSSHYFAAQSAKPQKAQWTFVPTQIIQMLSQRGRVWVRTARGCPVPPPLSLSQGPRAAFTPNKTSQGQVTQRRADQRSTRELRRGEKPVFQKHQKQERSGTYWGAFVAGERRKTQEKLRPRSAQGGESRGERIKDHTTRTREKVRVRGTGRRRM